MIQIKNSTFVVNISGAPVYDSRLELKCVVECDPSCNISWFSNGTAIEQDSSSSGSQKTYSGGGRDSRQPSYEVKTFKRLALPDKDLMSHVESVLEVHLDSQDKRRRDNTNYTCKGSANTVGGAVESTTTFKIHFPPSDIVVTPR